LDSPSSTIRIKQLYYGYVIAGASVFLQVIMWGIFNTYGVFFLPLHDEFGWSRAAISGARSLSMVIWGFMSILLGNLNDRFGPRIIMAACGCFFGVGYYLMSQINDLWQLYIFHGIIIGIGVSATDVVILSTVARWFIKRRGMMTGIIKVGTGLGMFIMPLVATTFILSYSWRTAYVFLGAMGFLIIISLAQLLRRDPSQKKQIPDVEKGVKGVNLKATESGLSFSNTIRTRRLWITATLYFTIWFCVNVVLVHVVPHATDMNFSLAEAAGILSAVGASSIVGRFVLGTMSDRIGCRRAITICCITFVISFIILLLATSYWMLISFAVIYGVAHGGFATLISPLVSELFGLRSHGTILGLIIFFGSIGGAISPVFAGYMFDTTSSYQIVFLTCLFMGIMGLVLSFTLKPAVQEV
jgi:MFS family permease